MYCLCPKPCVLVRQAGGLFRLRCAGSTASVGTETGIAAERVPLLYAKGIVMRRTLQGKPEKAQNGWAGEEVTLPWNVALCRVTLGIITAELCWLTEAVWNKQVEFTWFYAGYAFSSSFVCDYVCRDHRGNKGNMTGRCLVYWCAVALCIQHTFVLFRATGLCVSCGRLIALTVHIAIFVLNWDRKYMWS